MFKWLFKKKRRAHVLNTTDLRAKYSFSDVYVSYLNLNALRFEEFDLVNIDNTVPSEYQIDLFHKVINEVLEGDIEKVNIINMKGGDLWQK